MAFLPTSCPKIDFNHSWKQIYVCILYVCVNINGYNDINIYIHIFTSIWTYLNIIYCISPNLCST